MIGKLAAHSAGYQLVLFLEGGGRKVGNKILVI